MFERIFPRAKRKGKAPDLPGASSSPPSALDPPAPTAGVDESLPQLSRELLLLAKTPVPAQARERGWAALSRELEHRPLGRARTRRPVYTRPLRWVLTSAAAALAVLATVLGLYGGGLLQTAEAPQNPTTVSAVASSLSTEPPTTLTTPSTPASTRAPLSTAPSVSTTAPDVSPASTTKAPTSSSSPPSSPPTTKAPPTTKPPAPSTTAPVQRYTASEREGSARALAVYLADLVVTGNMSGARALVAPEAQAALAQMVLSLSEPTGYQVSGVESLSDTLVLVRLAVDDRQRDGQGQVQEATVHFAVKVRVTADGAVVAAINAGW